MISPKVSNSAYSGWYLFLYSSKFILVDSNRLPFSANRQHSRINLPTGAQIDRTDIYASRDLPISTLSHQMSAYGASCPFPLVLANVPSPNPQPAVRRLQRDRRATTGAYSPTPWRSREGEIRTQESRERNCVYVEARGRGHRTAASHMCTMLRGTASDLLCRTLIRPPRLQM